MQDSLFKHKKKIIIAGVVLLVVIIGISIFSLVRSKIYSATLNIRVTPISAEVKIGDKNYKTTGTYKVKPGNYDVEVSAEGFITKTDTIEINEDETIDFQVFLLPTEENADWYDEHPDDSLILGEIKYSLTLEALEKLQEENPILNELPMNIDYFTSDGAKRVNYSISYKLEENNTKFHIVITDYSGGNYNDAITRLEKRGVAKDQYEIEYVDKTEDMEWGHAGD
ncbi:PEGA domain-containing protein [Candidatus Saccharibacteria bacterium]|nr:PEGA domain-containing protein [Candidatus Saccharibacteria bacterium]MBR3253447.1 PEGA domain-containing protein [Candidatus Saccharibacteria bacterium]